MRNTTPVPDPVPDPETEKPSTALRAGFERFWLVYPKRVGKDAAWRSWQRRKPADDLTERILAAVEHQSRQPQWTKDHGQFIPNPATWLNQGRWEDEAPRVAANPAAVARIGVPNTADLEKHQRAIAQQLEAARKRQAGV